MTEEQTNQEPLYEAPASANVKVRDPQGFEWMVTVRDRTGGGVFSKMNILREVFMDNLWTPAQGFRPQPTQTHTAPETNGSTGESSESLTFAAETLTATIEGEKVYWKVRGGRFTQYGVIVWPEVLNAANLDPNPHSGTFDLAGYTAHYILNDKGNPAKVTKLERVG